MEHEVASLVFAAHITGSACQWWDCSEPAIGTGLFCSPNHELDNVIDVCERHKGTAEFYNEE